ncbi:MAG: 50S ribosomal protein L11 methyltransferase [Ginsengibacter sp.]
METFFKIEIETNSLERLEILMAELSDIDFYAFEENKNVLIAYIREKDFDRVKLRNVMLVEETYKSEKIDSRNWNEEWETGLKPILIEKFVGIRASFHQPLQNVRHEIIITPKMSFGTGHHATTYLMIKQMEKIDFMGKKVLDFGTGTGVLAILAEKLGAKEILAIDNDDWSIANAAENFQANNCKQVVLEKRDDINGVMNQDVILANINTNILLQNAADLSLLCDIGAMVVLSGFLFNDKPAILSRFEGLGFEKNTESEKNNWISVLLYKEESPQKL